MSRLKVDNIEARSGNNISMDDALKLKHYTESQRDALTSTEGDIIYNSDTDLPEYYDGSSWTSLANPVMTRVDYLIIAGGGTGGNGETNLANGGGGGARGNGGGQSQNGGFGGGGSNMLGGETPDNAGYSFAGAGNGVGNNFPGKTGGAAAAASGSGGGGSGDSRTPPASVYGGRGGSGIVLIAYPS